MSEPTNYKEYIGDGVYIDFDGYSIILTTENGIETSNVIVLEPFVIKNLNEYVKRQEFNKNKELCKKEGHIAPKTSVNFYYCERCNEYLG